MQKYSRGEKRKCKFYNYGKCKIKEHGKDCMPRTKDGALPETVEECSGFVPIEAGEKIDIENVDLEEIRNAEKLSKELQGEIR